METPFFIAEFQFRDKFPEPDASSRKRHPAQVAWLVLPRRRKLHAGGAQSRFLPAVEAIPWQVRQLPLPVQWPTGFLGIKTAEGDS